jgi:hypothetical protein
MLYPHWSALADVTLSAWLRAGQLCLCSEDPSQGKSRVGIDCWLGDRWATARNWRLVLQIPPLEDPIWHRSAMVGPQESRRPVVLAVQDSSYGGFRIGKYMPVQGEGRWLVYISGRWELLHHETILGWLPIPQRLSRAQRRSWQSLGSPKSFIHVD